MSSGSLTINTPASLVQCETTDITWSGGVPPYYLGYTASGTISTSNTPAIEFLTNSTTSRWQVAIAGGTQITLRVTDTEGRISYSSPISVSRSSNYQCLPGYSPANTTSNLGTGGLIGIIVGVVLALVCICTVLGCICVRRRRRRRAVGAGKEGKMIDEKNGEEPRLVPFVQRREEVDLLDEGTLTGSESATATATLDEEQGESRARSPVDVKAGAGISPMDENRTHATRPSSELPSSTSAALHEGLDSNIGGNVNSDGRRHSSGAGSSNPVGQIERDTKDMLGLASPPTTQHISNIGSSRRLPNTPQTPTRMAGSDIPRSSLDRKTAAEARLESNTTSIGTPTPLLGPLLSNSASSAGANDQALPVEVGREQEVEYEYVRHTDGGGVMRVELPPLYSEVPRREG